MKPEAHERLIGSIPLRRTGRLEEIANAVSYIFGNDYFTGRILELDGGFPMQKQGTAVPGRIVRQHK